jgi:hypothetical protein
MRQHLLGNWYWTNGWIDNGVAGLGLGHGMLHGDALATQHDGSEIELHPDLVKRLRNACDRVDHYADCQERP